MIGEIKEFMVSLFHTGEVVVDGGTKSVVSWKLIQKCEKEYERAKKKLFDYIRDIGAMTVRVEDDAKVLDGLKAKRDAQDAEYRSVIEKCKSDPTQKEVAVRKLRIVKLYEDTYVRMEQALERKRKEVDDTTEIIKIGKTNLDIHRAELDALKVQYETQKLLEKSDKVVLDWNSTRYLDELRNIVRVNDATEKLKKAVGMESEAKAVRKEASVDEAALVAQVDKDIAAL